MHRKNTSPVRVTLGLIALVAYAATVPAANWAVVNIDPLPVWFWGGITAPAGVYVVGVALGLRDAVHRLMGRPAALGALALGIALSYLLASPKLAVASTVAFALSEGLDFFLFERLRRRGLTQAVAASGAGALVVDSLVFLWLAFGSLEYLAGQIIGKGWMTLAATAVVAGWLRWAPRLRAMGGPVPAPEG